MTNIGHLRSLLFVPVLREQFVANAAEKGASAIVLDLEDSIPPHEKSRARDALPGALNSLRKRGARTLVRVNSGSAEDLLLCAQLAPWGIVLPKVNGARDLVALVEVFGSAEKRPLLLATIETAAGLIESAAIAHTAVVDALMFGAGDFALDTGMIYHEEVMAVPAIHVVIAARAAGLPAYGLAGPITDYADKERFRSLAVKSRAIGFVGAPVVHPSQIAIVEEAFAPSSAELDRARRIVEHYEATDGLPSSAGGHFIEWPLYRAACELLGLPIRAQLSRDK